MQQWCITLVLAIFFCSCVFQCTAVHDLGEAEYADLRDAKPCEMGRVCKYQGHVTMNVMRKAWSSNGDEQKKAVQVPSHVIFEIKSMCSTKAHDIYQMDVLRMRTAQKKGTSQGMRRYACAFSQNRQTGQINEIFFSRKESKLTRLIKHGLIDALVKRVHRGALERAANVARLAKSDPSDATTLAQIDSNTVKYTFRGYDKSGSFVATHSLRPARDGTVMLEETVKYDMAKPAEEDLSMDTVASSHKNGNSDDDYDNVGGADDDDDDETQEQAEERGKMMTVLHLKRATARLSANGLIRGLSQLDSVIMGDKDMHGRRGYPRGKNISPTYGRIWARVSTAVQRMSKVPYENNIDIIDEVQKQQSSAAGNNNKNKSKNNRGPICKKTSAVVPSSSSTSSSFQHIELLAGMRSFGFRTPMTQAELYPEEDGGSYDTNYNPAKLITAAKKEIRGNCDVGELSDLVKPNTIGPIAEYAHKLFMQSKLTEEKYCKVIGSFSSSRSAAAYKELARLVATPSLPTDVRQQAAVSLMHRNEEFGLVHVPTSIIDEIAPIAHNPSDPACRMANLLLGNLMRYAPPSADITKHLGSFEAKLEELNPNQELTAKQAINVLESIKSAGVAAIDLAPQVQRFVYSTIPSVKKQAWRALRSIRRVVALRNSSNMAEVKNSQVLAEIPDVDGDLDLELGEDEDETNEHDDPDHVDAGKLARNAAREIGSWLQRDKKANAQDVEMLEDMDMDEDADMDNDADLDEDDNDEKSTPRILASSVKTTKTTTKATTTTTLADLDMGTPGEEDKPKEMFGDLVDEQQLMGNKDINSNTITSQGEKFGAHETGAMGMGRLKVNLYPYKVNLAEGTYNAGVEESKDKTKATGAMEFSFKLVGAPVHTQTYPFPNDNVRHQGFCPTNWFDTVMVKPPPTQQWSKTFFTAVYILFVVVPVELTMKLVGTLGFDLGWGGFLNCMSSGAMGNPSVVLDDGQMDSFSVMQGFAIKGKVVLKVTAVTHVPNAAAGSSGDQTMFDGILPYYCIGDQNLICCREELKMKKITGKIDVWGQLYTIRETKTIINYEHEKRKEKLKERCFGPLVTGSAVGHPDT